MYALAIQMAEPSLHFDRGPTRDTAVHVKLRKHEFRPPPLLFFLRYIDGCCDFASNRIQRYT